MSHIKIIRRRLPTSGHKYLRNGNQFDYLGQILVQLGHDIPDKTRTPQDLGYTIPKFTYVCRNKVVNTCLSLHILGLDNKPKDLQESTLESLLPEFTFEWI